jgi:putative methyltransferase
VHAAENEHVVRAALRCDEAAAGPFGLAPRAEVLPAWPRRGVAEEMGAPGMWFQNNWCAHPLMYVFVVEDAASLIRCSPGEDATNGFFVSCFVRKEAAAPATSKRKAEAEDEGGAEVPKRKKKKKSKKAALAE